MGEAGGRLLVVDDNELNRDMLSRRLLRKGYQVEVASDGYEALKLISEGPFDLILLDIMMPGISGLEVLEKLRTTHSLMDLPVIMATAKNDSATIVQALKLGANDYVAKPLQFAEVLARVETQLTIRRQATSRTSGSFHKLEQHENPTQIDTALYCPSCLFSQVHDGPTCVSCGALRPADGWPERAPDRYPYLGRTISSKFYLEQFLDRGTTGSVYAARDLDLKRLFAAKIIDFSRDALGVTPDELRARTRMEVEAMVSLQNPHVVKIYEVAQIEPMVFALIMDYVKGLSLGAILKRLGHLKPTLALDIIRQVAQGLYEAHQQGIIHCDIKPDNIMLEKLPAGGYFVQILDFGIAHILDQPLNTEGFYGTPLYSAPERIREGVRMDHRADIYSLGAMLFHMITGNPPFVDENVYKVFTHHLHSPIPSVRSLIADPNLEEPLDQLIQRMMSKEPDQRHSSLVEVIEQIDSLSL
jgi:CheY-like chemotaxis protein